MRIRSHPPRGFKLIELLVIVLIVALGFGLVILPILSSREAGRRTQCSTNMRHIGIALQCFSASKNRFPNAGTFLDDPAVHGGNPANSIIARSIENPASFHGSPDGWLHSWVMDTIPYLNTSDLPNLWRIDESYLSTKGLFPTSPSPNNLELSSTAFGELRCPNDATTKRDQGNLSYVVNGGFSRWHAIPLSWHGGKGDGQSKNGGVLQWTPRGSTWQETQAINRKFGVMFLGTHTGDQPWDIATRPNDITDGSSMTFLLGENTLAGDSPGTPYSGGIPTNWACPLPNFCMFIASDDVCRSARSATDCLAGSLQSGPSGKDGKGWAWANRPGTFENVGYGQSLSVEGSFPFANSGHPGGGNFAFCDGSVQFLSNSIDGTVYAKLVSPAGGQLPPPLRQGPFLPESWRWEQAP